MKSISLLSLLFFTLTLFAQNAQLSSSLPAMTPYHEGCQDDKELEAQERCTQKKIRQFVYQNLGKPFTAKEIDGRKHVNYSFVIDVDGTLKDLKIEEDPGYGYGAAVVKSLKTLPLLIVPEKTENQVTKSKRIVERLDLNWNEAFYKRILEEDVKPSLEVFQVVDFMPAFAGCGKVSDSKERRVCSQEKMKNFVYENLKYPATAKENKTEGKVVVRFIVRKDGTLSGTKVVRSLTPECDEEALRLVKMMPKWNSGKQRQQPVHTYVNFVVEFKLDR